MPESPPLRLGPPAARVIRLRDFEAAQALFTNWQGRFEQLSSGRFEGNLHIIRGGLIRITGIESNQRILIRGHDSAGLFSVHPVTAGNAADLWQGYRLPPGHVVITGDHAEVDHLSARRTHDLGLSLRPESLSTAAQALLGTDSVILPHTWATAEPHPEGYASLINQMSHLLRLGTADPSVLGTAEGDRLEQECVRALVAALFPVTTSPPVLSLPARTRLLRRAEEYMRAHLSDSIGAIDLCRELGVSDRTLRLAFRERYGLGPMAYYKCLRLNAVRARLRGTAHVTVAAAALEFGIHHLGNFAADYRKLFGERPSETERGRLE